MFGLCGFTCSRPCSKPLKIKLMLLLFLSLAQIRPAFLTAQDWWYKCHVVSVTLRLKERCLKMMRFSLSPSLQIDICITLSVPKNALAIWCYLKRSTCKVMWYSVSLLRIFYLSLSKSIYVIFPQRQWLLYYVVCHCLSLSLIRFVFVSLKTRSYMMYACFLKRTKKRLILFLSLSKTTCTTFYVVCHPLSLLNTTYSRPTKIDDCYIMSFLSLLLSLSSTAYICYLQNQNHIRHMSAFRKQPKSALCCFSLFFCLEYRSYLLSQKIYVQDHVVFSLSLSPSLRLQYGFVFSRLSDWKRISDTIYVRSLKYQGGQNSRLKNNKTITCYLYLYM